MPVCSGSLPTCPPSAGLRTVRPGMKFKYRGIEDVMRVLTHCWPSMAYICPRPPGRGRPAVGDDPGQPVDPAPARHPGNHMDRVGRRRRLVRGRHRVGRQGLGRQGVEQGDDCLPASTPCCKCSPWPDGDDDGDSDPSVYHHGDVRSVPTPLNELVGLKGELQRRGLLRRRPGLGAARGRRPVVGDPDEDDAACAGPRPVPLVCARRLAAWARLSDEAAAFPPRVPVGLAPGRAAPGSERGGCPAAKKKEQA